MRRDVWVPNMPLTHAHLLLLAHGGKDCSAGRIAGELNDGFGHVASRLAAMTLSSPRLSRLQRMGGGALQQRSGLQVVGRANPHQLQNSRCDGLKRNMLA